MTQEYKKFVSGLIKPGEIMDSEVSEIEENMLNAALKLASECSTLEYVVNDILIQHDITRANRLEITHMQAGFICESAELIDPIKRIVIYRKDIHDKMNGSDKTYYNNIVEETGDIIFFLIGLQVCVEKIGIDDGIIKSANSVFSHISYLINEINIYIRNKYIESPKLINFDDILNHNQEKLRKRYEEGSYSDKQANERKDK